MGTVPENFHGVKGRSGRKSASVERQIVDQAKAAWSEDQEKDLLLAKIQTGKYSIWDMYRFKALIGDDKILPKFADKMLPDKLDISGDLNAYLSPEAVKEAVKRMKNEPPPL